MKDKIVFMARISSVNEEHIISILCKCFAEVHLRNLFETFKTKQWPLSQRCTAVVTFLWTAL